MQNPYCIHTNRAATTGRPASFPSWRQWITIGVRKAGADALAVVLLLETWAERSRERRRLCGLDARMLHDIGVTEAEAWREARKPFWRA